MEGCNSRQVSCVRNCFFYTSCNLISLYLISLSKMKNLLLLLILTSSNAYAQLRQYQDDSFAGYGSGGAIIVSIIIILVLIFGGSGGRQTIITLFCLCAFPLGFGWLGNTLIPEPKIGGSEASVGGMIFFFLGLYVWLKIWTRKRKGE